MMHMRSFNEAQEKLYVCTVESTHRGQVMRNSHCMVPLFSMQGHCLRHITIREAERMLEMKQAHRVSAVNRPLKVQLKALERADCASPATITVGELLANAFAHTSFKGAQSHT